MGGEQYNLHLGLIEFLTYLCSSISAHQRHTLSTGSTPSAQALIPVAWQTTGTFLLIPHHEWIQPASGPSNRILSKQGHLPGNHTFAATAISLSDGQVCQKQLTNQALRGLLHDLDSVTVNIQQCFFRRMVFLISRLEWIQ